MNQKADFFTKIIENTPWKNDSNPLWPFTIFILRRNLGKFFFPSKMQPSEAPQIIESIKGTLMGLPEMAQGYVLKKEDLTPLDQELLQEHFLFMKGFSGGTNAFSLLANPAVSLLATINIGNHLEFHYIDSKTSLDASWNDLSKIEGITGNQLEFAFSPRFGYLISDPTECGTGLTIQAFLHLPAIIQTEQFSDLWAKQNDESLTATGISGSPDDLIGDMVVIQNNFTLGVSEDAIIRSIQSSASKLITAEKTLRAQLKKESGSKIKDKISKAYGLLVHSYELDVKEALNLLSLIKLGIDLGWISGVQDGKINELFFKCRRGHFSHLFPESIDLKEIAHKRAEYLHSQLQGIQLTI